MFNRVPVDGKVVCFQPLVIKHRKLSTISLCIHLCVHVCVYRQGKLLGVESWDLECIFQVLMLLPCCSPKWLCQFHPLPAVYEMVPFPAHTHP